MPNCIKTDATLYQGSGLDKTAFDAAKVITHIFPTSIIDAMATNDILQIVVFSVFAGVAITAVGERAAPLVKAAEALVAVMLQITDYVMRFAPVAVFAAVAATLVEQGPGVIGRLAYFMGSVYVGLAVLWAVLIFATALWLAGALALHVFLARPLQRLTAAMHRAEEGDFVARAEVRGDDEISRLAGAFNRMLARLTSMKVSEIDTHRDLAMAKEQLALKRVLEGTNADLRDRVRELSLLYDLARAFTSTLVSG